MTQIKDPWHYPRPALAQAYLSIFDMGLVSAKGLFARRRMGKTEFLKQDLLPRALAARYLTAYANLWENRANPANALAEAVTAATAPKGIAKVLARLKRPVKKLKASGKVSGLGEGALEAEIGDDITPAGSVIAAALRAFDMSGRRLLLVLDEAQVLAGLEHADFAHALRAALDVRKVTVKVIFAGSSEATLRRMFARPSEPFYNWAALEPFDLLGRDFVEAMVGNVNSISKYPLKIADAIKAFEELKSTPEFFRQFLARYVTHPALGARAALAFAKDHVFSDDSFVSQWSSLLPADRELLRMLADGVHDLHGKSARSRLGTTLGLDGPAPLNTPAQGLKRLGAASIVTRFEHGRYRFEDEVFADWIRQQVD